VSHMEVPGYVFYSNFVPHETEEEIIQKVKDRFGVPEEDILVKMEAHDGLHSAFVKETHRDKVELFLYTLQLALMLKELIDKTQIESFVAPVQDYSQMN